MHLLLKYKTNEIKRTRSLSVDYLSSLELGTVAKFWKPYFLPPQL